MRTAYRCRAYPDQEQQAALTRTFGCVRVVWNRTLAERHRRWHTDHTGMSYAQSDRALTAMKQDPDLAFLAAVSPVPLQQTLRHQHQAFAAFLAKRVATPGSSPAAPGRPRITPVRRSPCVAACCGWPS